MSRSRSERRAITHHRRVCNECPGLSTIQHSYLAVDLGASSGRALVGTLEGDRIQLEEVHRFETPLLEDSGRLYWDIDEIEAEVISAVRLGLSANPALKSVSVDSWAVDYVPLGEDGTPLRFPYCYRDPRTRNVMEEALKHVRPYEIYAATGVQFMPINTLYQVLADHEMERDVVDRTRLRLPIADYLHYRLSGKAVAELSMASTTQLMNVRTHAWATDLMERFGIDPTTWPDIVPPGSRLGPLRTERWFDLPDRASDIEVIAGCSHDTACAVAAVPAEADSAPWLYISCGTWALLGVERTTPILSEVACDASFTNELGLDGTVRFLKNLMGLWVLQECERTWKEEGHQFDRDDLAREATEARDVATIVDLTDSRFAERGRMPHKLLAYCREHGLAEPKSRGEFVRLILKSIVAGFQEKMAVLESLINDRVECVHIVGGGAQNELLCQWTADATGRRVLAGPTEATALGNLLIQARTLNSLPRGISIRDVARGSSELRTYEPTDTS